MSAALRKQALGGPGASATSPGRPGRSFTECAGPPEHDPPQELRPTYPVFQPVGVESKTKLIKIGLAMALVCGSLSMATAQSGGGGSSGGSSGASGGSGSSETAAGSMSSSGTVNGTRGSCVDQARSAGHVPVAEEVMGLSLPLHAVRP